MSQAQFSYSVSTSLSRDRVWALFADIENWPKFSNVYDNLAWSGVPWQHGSGIVGTLHFPHSMPLRYVLETCQPGQSSVTRRTALRLVLRHTVSSSLNNNKGAH
jgi:hypothetical protein